VAEWGTDMRRFGTAGRLSPWTGVALRNDDSAEKRLLGKTRKGDRTLRTGLTQMAHATARTRGTYLSVLYQRPAAHRRKNTGNYGGDPCNRGQYLPFARLPRTV